MKVLFAVSNEEISESIIKRYQGCYNFKIDNGILIDISPKNIYKWPIST